MQQQPVEACSEYGLCWHGCTNAPRYCQRELDGTVAQCPSPLVKQERVKETSGETENY